MSDVTQIQCVIEAGDTKAAADLLPLVYDELRPLAAAKLAGESPDKRFRPRLWSMKPISGLSGASRSGNRTVADTSSPPQTRRWSGFWSITPVERTASSTEVHSGGSICS